MTSRKYSKQQVQFSSCEIVKLATSKMCHDSHCSKQFYSFWDIIDGLGNRLFSTQYARHRASNCRRPAFLAAGMSKCRLKYSRNTTQNTNATSHRINKNVLTVFRRKVAKKKIIKYAD
jgi:hypothetical protein